MAERAPRHWVLVGLSLLSLAGAGWAQGDSPQVVGGASFGEGKWGAWEFGDDGGLDIPIKLKTSAHTIDNARAVVAPATRWWWG